MLITAGSYGVKSSVIEIGPSCHSLKGKVQTISNVSKLSRIPHIPLVKLLH